MKAKSILPSLWSRPSSEVAPLRTLQSEINSLFNDFGMNPPMSQFWAGERSGYLDLCCEVSETDKAVEVTAEMPGVDEKDIEVTLDGDVLKIKAEKKVNKEEKTKDYHMVERSYGTFQRSLMLPFLSLIHI